MAIDTSNWSSPKPASIPLELVPVFERYLLGTLATDCSRMGNDFIPTLSLSYSSYAESYLNRMREHLNISFKDSSADVENEVNTWTVDPWTLDPFYICTRTENVKTKNQVERLAEYQGMADTKISEEVGPLIKRRFHEIDSIYRHLRNALAHGCFRLVNHCEGNRLFFYDLSGNSLTCVALVPLSTLEKWYSLACSSAKRQL